MKTQTNFLDLPDWVGNNNHNSTECEIDWLQAEEQLIIPLPIVKSV